MLPRLRESLALILLALLPFHAFLVTVLTKMIAGPGHAPLGYLAIWKEGVLVAIVLIALIELMRRGGLIRQKVDGIDWMIVGLVVLSFIVSALTHGDWKLFALGFKYDFLAPAAFVVLRRVLWSQTFWDRAVMTIVAAAVLLCVYGLLTLVLPQSVFSMLGYSDLHSLYVPGGPIAAFQQIGGGAVRRMQSAMSGPNHLGLWLLLPWSVGLVALLKDVSRKPKAVSTGWIAFLLLVGICIVLTLSRSAWIGAFVIALAAVSLLLPMRVRTWVIASTLGLVTIGALVLALLVPSIFIRLASSRDHIVRPIEAMQQMAQHPFGKGLGTAGPASNRVSDTCVFLDAGADAAWAADRPNLCVFVGDKQVQPERQCNCPFLPENWYLQIGVELGLAGFALFAGLILLVILRLKRTTKNVLFLTLLGVSIGALFLHAWEDAALAMSVWVLLATALPRPQNDRETL